MVQLNNNENQPDNQILKSNDYYVVLTDKEINKRWLVTINSLKNYVTSDYAFKARLKASKMKTNKCTIKMRNGLKIEINLK